MIGLVVFMIIWAMFMIASGAIAGRKRLGRIRWAAVAFFLGPLAVLLVLTEPPKGDTDEVDTSNGRPLPRPLIVPTDDEVAAIQLGAGDSVSGLRAHIDIQETGIKIRREEGTRNLLLHGLKGEKSISYRSISAIQLRMPAELTSGYIQFSIAGGVEGTRGIFQATKDENTVMFVDNQSARMLALRSYLERQIDAAHRPQLHSSPFSVADELTKLAELKDRGILSAEEFEARKLSLLS